MFLGARPGKKGSFFRTKKKDPRTKKQIVKKGIEKKGVDSNASGETIGPPGGRNMHAKLRTENKRAPPNAYEEKWKKKEKRMSGKAKANGS